MKRINEVSKENYDKKVKPFLTESQQRVLNCFNGTPLILDDVCEILHTEKNKISGRITELVKKGNLKRVEKEINSDGNRCWSYIRIIKEEKNE